MSLFLLAALESHARETEKLWIGLYGEAEAAQLENGLWLVTSGGYRATAQTPAAWLVLGTAFNDAGFHSAAWRLVSDPWDAPATQDQLRGHWLAVVSDGARSRVYTDPVGMLNVFFASDPNVVVSNSLTAIAALLPTAAPDRLGVLEFVTKESGIAGRTQLDGVQRLRFQHQLDVTVHEVRQSPLPQRVPERLDEPGYRERISRYFSALASYPGRVAVELSSGYDTRLVAACASPALPGLRALSNENRRDGGVDLLLAQQLSKRLRLPLSIMFRGEATAETQAFLHATHGGRNCLRSSSDLALARAKYAEADLVLGGYGGEVVRASYAKFDGLESHVLGYYARKAWLEKHGLLAEFTAGVSAELQRDYVQPWLAGPRQLSQWLYAVDRMRIWGGARSHLMSLHGDQLHPFMDWYLLEPLLAWPVADLDDARLQRALIDHFAPEISHLPFNPKVEQLPLPQRLRAKRLVRSQAYDPGQTPAARSLVSAELCAATGISLEAALRLGDGVGLDRLATVQQVLDLAGPRPGD